MRIVASWFGSNGSTVYKDVAAGFDNHRQLESGLHLVFVFVFKSSDRVAAAWDRSASILTQATGLNLPAM
jgi:hypothetical protein